MKRLFVKFSLVLACMLAASLQADAATEKLRIMTYNIPYGNIKVTDGNGQNTWENRVKAIHNYVDSISPDLLGIQEGVKAELTSILAGIPGYAMVGCAREDGAEKGEYTPILYKTSRFLLEESGNYWPTSTPDVPSKTPDAICYRIVTWALFTDKATGARFIYTNTHLDHGAEAVRISQAKVVKEKMAELADFYGTDLPQLLTADFNMNRTSNVYPYLINYKLKTKDMWSVARKTVQSGVDGMSSTPENQIDFIFAYGPVSCSYAELGNRNTPDGFIMSDHNPHFADVSWTTSVSDDARAAIADARSAADSTFLWQSSHTKLLTAASQLTTDGIESSTSITNVYDRNTSTYVRSLYSGSLPPNQPHYIQVALREPLSAFSVQYNKSLDGDTGQDDRWEDVIVYASQDAENWDYITELFDFSGVVNKTYSANVQMRRPYQHIRFQVMRTKGMVLSNGAPRYSLSELQIYENSPFSTCDYVQSEDISKAVDALYAQADQLQQLIDDGSVTAADIASLVEATKALRQARLDFAQSVGAVTESGLGTPCMIYSPDGKRQDSLYRGVNIIRAKDGKSRKVLLK
ncbi:MAG: endonuclease/exonuclease/phosphatase family protein [Bacteroidaceae bacterium]